MAQKGPVETTSPMTYAHAVLEVGDVVEWLPEEGHTALIHVFDGEARVNESTSVSGEDGGVAENGRFGAG